MSFCLLQPLATFGGGGEEERGEEEEIVPPFPLAPTKFPTVVHLPHPAVPVKGEKLTACRCKSKER